MIVGIPKEIKKNEYRVSMTPAGVQTLVERGHPVLVEASAGKESGFSDEEYSKVGATIFASRDELFGKAKLIVKVKEPQPEEFHLLNEKQILFTFLHLAPNRPLTEALLKTGVTAIAYETVESDDGSLPILTPMSEVAGKIAVQNGACLLQKNNHGRGILLSGVPGVGHGRIVIIGGGVVGLNAAKVASALGADVTVLDVDLHRLAYLDDIFGGKVETIMSNTLNIATEAAKADLIIGAVLQTGALSPRLVKKTMIAEMKEGSVIVDVSIDQGGCVETSRPTSHGDPTYVEMGVVHYCVTNMPGAVPRTSTLALGNTTLPYIQRLADFGLAKCLEEDKPFSRGVNICKGTLTHQAVAQALGMEYNPLAKVII
jgi:alanine dehydrogenase